MCVPAVSTTKVSKFYFQDYILLKTNEFIIIFEYLIILAASTIQVLWFLSFCFFVVLWFGYAWCVYFDTLIVLMSFGLGNQRNNLSMAMFPFPVKAFSLLILTCSESLFSEIDQDVECKNNWMKVWDEDIRNFQLSYSFRHVELIFSIDFESWKCPIACKWHGAFLFGHTVYFFFCLALGC